MSRKLIEAKTVIGENAPKYLLSKGYAVLQTDKGVDYYALTKDGEVWLINGLLRYLKLHPERALDCKELPLGYGLRPAKKTPQIAANKLQNRGLVIRRRRA